MPWFKRSDGILFSVLERYDELLARLRKEAGWQEVPDPFPMAAPPSPVAVPALENATPPEPERATQTPEPSPSKSAVKRPVVKAKAPRRRPPTRRPAARKAALHA